MSRHRGILLLESKEGRQTTKHHCDLQNIPQYVIDELVQAELDQVGKMRKRGLTERFDEIFDALLDEEDGA